MSATKKKMVLKVTMKDRKSRSKALKTAAGLSGVESASFKGEDKSQIEVTGTVDAVKLTKLLIKKVGYAELVSVTDAGADGEKKKESETQMYYVSTPYNLQCYGQPVPSYEYVEHHGPLCSIL